MFSYKASFLVLLFCLPLSAESEKKTQSARSEVYSAAEQLNSFTLPEGFTIELVASEKNGLINPIDIAFDDAGRMWTQTAEMYPLDKGQHPEGNEKIEALYKLEERGTDKILIIADPTRPVEGQIPVFSEGMALPQSILPYKNGVYVAHGTEMLFMEDTDGDGKSDRHETVLTGFGYSDTHTMSHTLVRGPGGWVHFSHGALNRGKVSAVKSGNSATIDCSKIARFSLDGTRLEVVNNGHNNIWGFHLKANGQWYGSEANDRFYSLAPLHPLMGYSGIGSMRLKEYQPFPEGFHKFTVSGTGISGLTYDENGSKGWPEKWKKVGFLANPITNTINCVIADRNPDGSVISEHLPDFLSCSDDWFRPVNIEFGPDGCLYIVDWYNKIVSHNEVKRDHPDRDKSHGRIWRVRHESQKVSAIPKVSAASEKALLSHLRAEILWEKRAAWHQIVDRGVKSLIPELKKIVLSDQERLETRIVALWSLEGLGAYDFQVMTSLMEDADPDIRREALRSLKTFNPDLEDLLALTSPAVEEAHYMVKEQALRTLASAEKANAETIKLLVSACNPVTTQSKNANPFGGVYEENFQRFLAMSGLENFPSELDAFLESPAASTVPSENLIEATKALPVELRAQKILSAIEEGTAKLDADNLVSLSPILSDPLVRERLGEQLSTKGFIQLALDTRNRLQPSLMQEALAPGLQQLMASAEKEDQSLAVQTAIQFQCPALNETIMKRVTEQPLSEITTPSLDLLSISATENQPLLKQILSDDTVRPNLKGKALLALASASLGAATNECVRLYEQADESEKTTLLNSMAASSHGAAFILHLIKEKQLTAETLDHDMREKVAYLHPHHPISKDLISLIKEGRKKRELEAEEKVQNFLKATETLTGNPQTGEALFNSCLACHQVGEKGYNIAPSLGGSAHRDLHHLLTAIVKPDDAMEGGYRLYRVIKKNGDLIEGYMYSRNDHGTTLSFMGGAQHFTHKEHIQKEEYVDDKSFMVDSFGNLPEQSMIDLLSYIKTIQ